MKIAILITSFVYSRHTRSGLSLVELLVAMALLSLVVGMGFVATSAIRRGYLVEARFAAHHTTKTFTFSLGFPVRERFTIAINALRYFTYCQQTVSLPPNFQ